jgi:hypothetical protein
MSLLYAHIAASRQDADAMSYVAAIRSAGATVTVNQREFINNFVRAEKAANRWSLIRRLYLPIWGVAAANAICIKARTSGTFVNGVTHSAGFVNSDGSTGYFLFDVAPSALGCTTSSGSVFALTTATSAIDGSVNLGRTQDVNNNSRVGLFSGSSGFRQIQVFNTPASSYVETDSRGILLASRTSTTNLSSYKRTSAGFSTVVNEVAVAAGTVGTVRPMTFMAWNNNGTISTYSPSTARFGSYGMNLGMTAAQAEGFTANLETLWEGATGLSIV